MISEPWTTATQVLTAYCDALDRRSEPDLRRLLHGDVTLELPDRTCHGIESVMLSYSDYLANSERITRHHLTNVNVLSMAEDRIGVRAYFLAMTAKRGAVSLASGAYEDELVLVSSELLIAAKKITLDIPFTRLAAEH